MPVLFFFRVVTYGHLTNLEELCLSQQELRGFNGRPGLNDDYDPIGLLLLPSCPLEVCLWYGNQGLMNGLKSVHSPMSWESETNGLANPLE